MFELVDYSGGGMQKVDSDCGPQPRGWFNATKAEQAQIRDKVFDEDRGFRKGKGGI